MDLYQLGKYNSKNDLSPQGTAIRNFVQNNYDFHSVFNHVNQYSILEHESVLILKKAILAGYWTSLYGFNWSKKQEIEFWELVYEKRQHNSGIPHLTLAESYRGNKIKTLNEVIELYFDAIEINPEHYYSLTQEGGEELESLLENRDFRKKCLLIELNIWENVHCYSIQEIEEEKPYILKRCKGDVALEEQISERIDKLLEKITTSNIKGS